MPGDPGITWPDPSRPLSGVVALSFVGVDDIPASDAAQLVRARVQQVAEGTLPSHVQFPLAPASTDSVRAIDGLAPSVIANWLDPLTYDESPTALRFGTNNDYLAYFGDGWDVNGESPKWSGSGSSGWLWVNHEYISNDYPTLTTAPVGQHLTLAKFLRANDLLTNDVTSNVWTEADVSTYVTYAKQQVGGTWMHIVQDPSTGAWELDRGAQAIRYDATSKTLLRITGIQTVNPDHDDTGAPLPAGVVPGIMDDCAGGQTPWGTIFSGEENVQDYYGDLEVCWTSEQKLVTGMGCDPGAAIKFDTTTSPGSEWGISADPNAWHDRDHYGYIAEIDVGQPSDEFEGKNAPGVGHKKLGAMGRARWEAATVAIGPDWKLIPNQPVVLYGGDDRRSGRVYKFVSSKPYTAGMTKPEIRALLDDGKLYAAHFAGLDNTTGTTLFATKQPPTEAAPGTGQWIELSVTSTQIAPNAAALGSPGITVGEALKSNTYNGLAGFPTSDDVRRALFTASAKVGIMELNRPEDVEYNPLDPSGKPRIYIGFTYHGRKTQLDQDGKLIDPAVHDMVSIKRSDEVGTVVAIEESNPTNPGASMSFLYIQAWKGNKGASIWDASAPDNVLIDKSGGVWFGTDGNLSINKGADAIYYLDLDPAHKAGQPGVQTATYGKAFRVLTVPSDAEATGPNMSADMRTIFVSVQHPGENNYSRWPWH
ncbi:DUF839 domain-containing protein [Polyangium aurulentum]|nr:DUF839 domain-containing protein [Polyangium aurulentum]